MINRIIKVLVAFIFLMLAATLIIPWFLPVPKEDPLPPLLVFPYAGEEDQYGDKIPHVYQRKYRTKQEAL